MARWLDTAEKETTQSLTKARQCRWFGAVIRQHKVERFAGAASQAQSSILPHSQEKTSREEPVPIQKIGIKSLQRMIKQSKARGNFERIFYRHNERPVVVLGNQRSGTSAIASLLADACSLTRTIDIPELWSPKFEEVYRKRQSLLDVIKANPRAFSRDVIKEPNLTFIHEQLVEILPHARFLFVVRDPRNNIRSMLNRIGVRGDLSELSIEQLKSIKPSWRGVLDAALWPDGGPHYVSVLSTRWNDAADVYLKSRPHMPLIRYEDFCRDKINKIRQVATNLNLEATADISDRVDLQFQPTGDNSLSWGKFFGAENLARITQICGSRFSQFGYPGFINDE